MSVSSFHLRVSFVPTDTNYAAVCKELYITCTYLSPSSILMCFIDNKHFNKRLSSVMFFFFNLLNPQHAPLQ